MTMRHLILIGALLVFAASVWAEEPIQEESAGPPEGVVLIFEREDKVSLAGGDEVITGTVMSVGSRGVSILVDEESRFYSIDKLLVDSLGVPVITYGPEQTVPGRFKTRAVQGEIRIQGRVEAEPAALAAAEEGGEWGGPPEETEEKKKPRFFASGRPVPKKAKKKKKKGSPPKFFSAGGPSFQPDKKKGKGTPPSTGGPVIPSTLPPDIPSSLLNNPDLRRLLEQYRNRAPVQGPQN